MGGSRRSETAVIKRRRKALSRRLEFLKVSETSNEWMRAEMAALEYAIELMDDVLEGLP